MARDEPADLSALFGPHVWAWFAGACGVRCMNLHIGQKQAWLHVTHSGWRPGVRIEPDTDLESGEFTEAVLTRFEQNRAEIDEMPARPSRRPPV